MAVPTNKKSKSKRDMRRANHDRITLPQVSICDNCGADVLSHRACPACGWYKDRIAIPQRVVAAEIEGDGAAS
ncbi:MAG: 50S ribosomal protein L32 [Deltaproteobacteria bacterium]|nr:50S ribosomal protein L32 [Deltaproteobacteria bacterium]MCB9785798.1 50S ribosomal protein L32 [Deltaproteobacteria bacterium]